MGSLYVLDAMGLAYRAYYAFIRRPLVNSRGENTSAIFGLANTLLKLRREGRPDFWALAWDGPGPTHRHARFADYKATRKPMPPDFLTQIPAIQELAQALGLPVLEVPGAEADDVMATLAVRAGREGHDVALVTSDKDMLQLVNERVRLLSPVGRGEEYVWVDREAVRSKWGVAPEQTRDVLALMGDSVDNIPGVRGVGEKTAVELIARFGSLDEMFARIPLLERDLVQHQLDLTRQRLEATREGRSKGTRQLMVERRRLQVERRRHRHLRRSRDIALLSRELITVKTDLDLPFDWHDLRCGPVDRDALIDLADRFELERLKRIAEEMGVSEVDSGSRASGHAAERRGTAAETPSPSAKLTEHERERDPSVVTSATRDPIGPLPVPPAAPSLFDASEPAESRPFTARPAAQVVRSAPVAQASLDLWGRAALGLGEARLDEWTTHLHEVRARSIHGVAIFPVAGGDDPRIAPLVGVALAARDGTTSYVPLAHAPGPNHPAERAREWLAPLLADPSTPKVGEDLKRDTHLLAGAGFALEGLEFDVHLGSFLCDPERDHGIEALARDVLGIELPALEPAARGRVRPGDLPPERVRDWAAAAAAALFPLAEALRAQLEGRDQWRLYTQLEHPLIPVLLDMERAGIWLDSRVLGEMSDRATLEIARLEEELTELAGERINLNSGPQLARVLFEKLKLKTGRRTKTGFSTDQAVLEELAAGHPFPARLLEYRALSKLKSTYLDALPLGIDRRDGRVHTSYNQAGAATGRLSSSNPNLQNIPMRSTQGRAIRRAFVAPPGRTLVGADYSQIELRVMAHLSGDPNLIEAFRTGEDVHASTARRIFGVAADQLDPALRARAKVVNFGIMYGMGARSLSQQMGIGLAEAQDFIAHYFRVYARVREFLDGTIEEARRRGYVETLFGRRRYLPQLNEGHGGTRALAERAAINTPIQGSAADLMKLAMIRVHAALKQSEASARLLLQVHDELLIECAAEDAEAVAARVRTEMEGCFALRVPLVVSAGRGTTWFDVH